MKDRKRTVLEEPGSWVMSRRVVLESPAWQALPDNARRLLNRIELEHLRHGGTMNGRLVVTYDAFKAAHLRRASVALAIRQCVALGFLEVTRKGYKAAAEFRVPSTYRLTYVWGLQPGKKGLPPTEEWRCIGTDEEAQRALQGAAASPQSRSTKPPSPGNLQRRRASASGSPDATDAPPLLRATSQ